MKCYYDWTLKTFQKFYILLKRKWTNKMVIKSFADNCLKLIDNDNMFLQSHIWKKISLKVTSVQYNHIRRQHHFNVTHTWEGTYVRKITKMVDLYPFMIIQSLHRSLHINANSKILLIRQIQTYTVRLFNEGDFKNHNHYQFSSMSSSENQFLFQFIISFILTFDDFSLEKNNDKENMMMTTYFYDFN